VPAASRPDSQPVAATPVINADSEAIKQLQTEMTKIRTDLDLSRASLSATHGSGYATAALRILEEGKLKTSPREPIPPGQAVTVRILLDAPLGMRRRAAASQSEPLKAAHREDPASNEKDDAQRTREYSALVRAHSKLEMALEKAATEKQSLTKRIKDLERQYEEAKSEAEDLRKQLEPLREVLLEEDPLLFLMRSKVNLQHLIAVGREAMGSNKHGRRLPDEKPETRQAAAVYAAQAARQAYFALRDSKRPGRTTWVVEGRRLDPVSEQKLRSLEEQKLKKLEQELSLVKRLQAGL